MISAGINHEKNSRIPFYMDKLETPLFRKLDDILRTIFSQVGIFKKQPGLFAEAESSVLLSDVFRSIHGLQRRIPNDMTGFLDEQLRLAPFL